MPEPVYFETSALLEVLNSNSVNAPNIRLLIEELQQRKTVIYTSILSVQEASVLSFRNGGKGDDVYGYINRFARIYTIDKEVALQAAKLEAAILDHFKTGLATQDVARHLRRWDCIHLATAQVLRCREFFAYDKHFKTRASQIQLGTLRILEPIPTQPSLLTSQANLQLVPKKP